MSKETHKSLKKFPKFKSDKEAEDFVDTADLSEYDLSEFKPMSFEFEPKDKAVTLRLSSSLLEAVKINAGKEGIPYQRYIRHVLEKMIHGAV
jgi:predicted DNA binding CopG/RHH family protein